MSSFQEYYPRMRELADYLLNNPELGYKEYKTSEAIEEAIHEITPMVKVEHFCTTGIKVVFNNHQTKTIGIIAELDSLYQPGHRNAKLAPKSPIRLFFTSSFIIAKAIVT